MIASGLAVEGSHGLGHPLHFTHPHHMTFGAPPVPEFLRPLPKPAPLVPRYNGAAGRTKYESSGPVNLAQQQTQQQSSQQSQAHKEEDEFLYNTRLFPPPPPPPPFSHYPSLPGPYGSLYPAHYTPLLSRDRPNLPQPSNPPLSPLEAYPGPNSAPNSPASTYSPPGSATVKSSHPSYRDRKFKVPSGKEGSLKHRILTTTTAVTSAATPTAVTTAARPDIVSSSSVTSSSSLSSVSSLSSSSLVSKHKKRGLQIGNGSEVLPASFNRGSLIQLANGELKRVEDMRTEDFVTSAERSPALRLDPSTVVRIESSTSNKSVNLLTLSYGENKSQVEIESLVEHPYFVYGQGWASCSPEKTMVVYGLKCHRLQVGDVCISLSPRPSLTSSASSNNTSSSNNNNSISSHDVTMVSISSSSLNSCKKRRWSAPDQYEALNQQSTTVAAAANRKTND